MLDHVAAATKLWNSYLAPSNIGNLSPKERYWCPIIGKPCSIFSFPKIMQLQKIYYNTFEEAITTESEEDKVALHWGSIIDTIRYTGSFHSASCPTYL